MNPKLKEQLLGAVICIAIFVVFMLSFLPFLPGSEASYAPLLSLGVLRIALIGLGGASILLLKDRFGKKTVYTIAAVLVVLIAAAFFLPKIMEKAKPADDMTYYSGAQTKLRLAAGVATYDCSVDLHNANKAEIKLHLQDSADAVYFENCVLLEDLVTAETGQISFSSSVALPTPERHYRLALTVTAYNADGARRVLEPLYSKEVYY